MAYSGLSDFIVRCKVVQRNLQQAKKQKVRQNKQMVILKLRIWVHISLSGDRLTEELHINYIYYKLKCNERRRSSFKKKHCIIYKFKDYRSDCLGPNIFKVTI